MLVIKPEGKVIKPEGKVIKPKPDCHLNIRLQFLSAFRHNHYSMKIYSAALFQGSLRTLKIWPLTFTTYLKSE
jgi:hypothetical protein